MFACREQPVLFTTHTASHFWFILCSFTVNSQCMISQCFGVVLFFLKLPHL